MSIIAAAAWLVADGIKEVRLQASGPVEAFNKAKDQGVLLVNMKTSCRALDDKGEQIGPWYHYRNGGAIPDMMRCPRVDKPFCDNRPATQPHHCAPADPAKQVIMVGKGPSAKGYFPMFREKFPKAEIWAVNDMRVEGQTRHFQVHQKQFTPECPDSYWHVDDLIATGVRVYTHDNYPFDQIRRLYLGGTPCYMLALADLEGFGVVCMPGIDYQGLRRPAEVHFCRYWVGVLEGKGVVVHRTIYSRMFRALVYGNHTYEDMCNFEAERDPV